MPLIVHRKLPSDAELGLWRITESEAFFSQQLDLSDAERAYIARIKGHRRLEWLAGRLLLHHLSGRETRGACYKVEFGKPHLENSRYDISISHSRELAAVLAAPRRVGIDIQKLVGKIERLTHKFLRPNELASLSTTQRLEHLHVYWGAKEALYKAYGRRELDFRQHLLITPFSFDLHRGQCHGTVHKDAHHSEYQLHYEQLDDYILVYALELDPS